MKKRHIWDRNGARGRQLTAKWQERKQYSYNETYHLSGGKVIKW